MHDALANWPPAERAKADAALQLLPEPLRAFYVPHIVLMGNREGEFAGLVCKACNQWQEYGHKEDCPARGIDVPKAVAPMRLDIGCGQNKRGAEWVGVDTHETADIQAPMWAVPLPDACADAIYSSHALEHVMKAQVIPTLREWRRLLRSGGEMTLRVPDLEWCIRNWMATGMGNGWELDTIFGSQEHEGNCHRTGFTRPMLRFYLSRAGFQVVAERTIESHGQPTIEVVCR